MGPTQKLASFIEGTRLKSIPKPVVETAKNLILNVLGSMLAGSTEKTGKIGMALVKEGGGARHSTVAGGGFKTSALMAALANGISAHATDHLGDATEQGLREILRVLKPGGRFLLVVWVPGWMMFAVANVMSFFLRPKHDWRRLTQRAGFEIADEGMFNGVWFLLLRKPTTAAEGAKR